MPPARRPQEWTPDQLINSSWLGPRLCEDFSALWVKTFSVPTDVKYSQFLMQSMDSLDADVVAKIECALDLLPRHTKQRHQPVAELPLPASVPSFGEASGRSKLASSLRAFACWKPDVGYQPDLALLAAHIMSVAGNERVTFQALVTIYRQYRLKDYFEGPDTEEAIRCDAAKVWVAARLNFPGLADAFSRFNQAQLFQAAVSSLLSTLLTQTHCPALQPFEYHVRLLHSFLLPTGEYDSSAASPTGAAHHGKA